MADFVMRANGNDTTGTGSAANPYKTLSKCCQVAGSDDTIHISDTGGVYFFTGQHSFKPVGTSGHLLTIKPYQNESPIFDGTGAAIAATDAILALQTGSKYCTFGGGSSNIEVRNCAQGNAKGRGIAVGSGASDKCRDLTFQNIIIRNVWTRAFGGAGINITFQDFQIYDAVQQNIGQALGGGGWAGGVSSFTFSDGSLSQNWIYRRGRIERCWGEGLILLRLQGGEIDNVIIKDAFSKTLYMDKCSDCTVKNSGFYFTDPTYQRDAHNSDGITFAVEGTPLESPGVHNCLIYNNIIAGCRDGFLWFTDSNFADSSYEDIFFYHNSMYALTRYGMRIEGVGSGASPSGCLVKNNSFDGTMVTLEDPSAWTFTNNRWDSIPAVDTHTNSITAEPQYSNPTLNPSLIEGFQPLSTSPLIGAGTPVAAVTTDRAGNARSGTAPAIGAYETSTAVVTANVAPKVRGVRGYFG